MTVYHKLKKSLVLYLSSIKNWTVKLSNMLKNIINISLYKCLGNKKKACIFNVE